MASEAPGKSDLREASRGNRERALQGESTAAAAAADPSEEGHSVPDATSTFPRDTPLRDTLRREKGARGPLVGRLEVGVPEDGSTHTILPLPLPLLPSRSEVSGPPAPTRRLPAPPPWASDADLVCSILTGSRPHFELLYATYFPRIFRFALKRLGDQGEAEDVAQDVFVAVFCALHTYAGTSSLSTWIFGITRNHVNQRFRRKRIRLESLEGHEADELDSGQVPTDRVVEARRMLRTCERLMESELSSIQRRIFYLKYQRRQSVRAIARALGKSEDAVKTNLYRMRRALVDAAPELEQILSA